MNGLLLQRLIWLLPTLLAVLCFTFFLSQSAPGDEVTSILSLEGKNVNVSRKDYMKLYSDAQSQLALDRPIFYVTIRPHYQPASLFHIVPKAYRETLCILNKEVMNWSSVEAYHLALSAAIDDIDMIGSAYNKLRTDLNQLQKNRSVSEVKASWQTIKNAMSSQDGMPPQLSESMQSLEKAIIQLKPATSFWTYPVMSWHGTNNQFHYWLGQVINPSGRKSLRDGSPVMQKIGSALLWTLSFSMTALLLSCFLSVLISLWQVKYQDSFAEWLLSAVLYVFYAIPLFWLATMAVVFLTNDEYGSWTNIFPSIGLKYWMADEPISLQIYSRAKLLILPVICLTMGNITYLTRQLKTDLIRQKHMPFALAAKAKGVSDFRLIRNHLLPNALIPFITIVTGAIPGTFVGSVVIEVIFNIPGIGKLLLDSIHYADWPVSFSIILLVGVVTILSYLLADILYLIFYPQLSKRVLSNP